MAQNLLLNTDNVSTIIVNGEEICVVNDQHGNEFWKKHNDPSSPNSSVLSGCTRINSYYCTKCNRLRQVTSDEHSYGSAETISRYPLLDGTDGQSYRSCVRCGTRTYSTIPGGLRININGLGVFGQWSLDNSAFTSGRLTVNIEDQPVYSLNYGTSSYMEFPLTLYLKVSSTITTGNNLIRGNFKCNITAKPSGVPGNNTHICYITHIQGTKNGSYYCIQAKEYSLTIS